MMVAVMFPWLIMQSEHTETQPYRIVTVKHVSAPLLGVLNVVSAPFNIFASLNKRQ
jgi:hypothetical protein